MTRKKSSDKPKKPVNTILIVFVVLLSLVQILLSNKIATEGKRLKELEQEIAKLEENNSKLELEIVANGRLHQLVKEAENLGFVENPSIINLTSQVPIALSPYSR